MRVMERRQQAGLEPEKVKRSRSEHGVALVEFALVLPMVLLFLLGISDFGRAIYYKNTLENAAREGARCGIVAHSDKQTYWTTDGNAPSVYTSTQPYAGTDTIVGATARLMAGLDPSQVTVTINLWPGWDLPNAALTVRVDYAYRPATSLLGLPDILLTGESTMRTE